MIQVGPRDWTAIRSGTRYCAPACGRGCTYAEYQAAVKNADKLIRALGPKWKPRVHENLGWHFSAVPMKGDTDISVSGEPGAWMCFTGTMLVGHGNTPKEAVKDADRQLTALAHGYIDLAAILEEAC